jgi:hypothetical protein
MNPKLLLLLALCLPLPAIADWNGIEWPQKLYNPKPLPDDLLLPLPCGGAMAFRRVATETPGPLDDLRIEVGSDTEDRGYAEHTHPAYVAGAFSGAQARRRDLLIGKYEVTRLQFEAVMATDPAACPKPRRKGRLPQTRVSRHAADQFAYRWSLWLRANAASLPTCRTNSGPCLPREDGDPAFVRLPTEAEWEYAARGGGKVSPADFREPLPPMAKDLEHTAWFNQNAGGKVRPIGVLAANPLGLHDMIGNVEEIALDPFRLQRLDRDHGQVGGYVVRGGSIHSARDELRSSLRREVPLYDDKGAVATADTGFRVSLALPVIRSQARLQQIEQAWQRLGSDTSKPLPSLPARPRLRDKPFQDPILELTALARAAPDPNMKRRLERLRSVMAEQNQKLFDQRNRSARETLRLGGLLCLKLHDEGRNVEAKRATYRACVEANGKHYRRCVKRAQALADLDPILDTNQRIYADTIVRTAQNFPDDLRVLDHELAGLREEIKGRGYGKYVAYPALFHRQVLSYADSGRVRRDRWFTECTGQP